MSCALCSHFLRRSWCCIWNDIGLHKCHCLSGLMMSNTCAPPPTGACFFITTAILCVRQDQCQLKSHTEIKMCTVMFLSIWRSRQEHESKPMHIYVTRKMSLLQLLQGIKIAANRALTLCTFTCTMPLKWTRMSQGLFSPIPPSRTFPYVPMCSFVHSTTLRFRSLNQSAGRAMNGFLSVIL